MPRYGVKLSDGYETEIEAPDWLRAGAYVNQAHIQETGANAGGRCLGIGECPDIISFRIPKEAHT